MDIEKKKSDFLEKLKDKIKVNSRNGKVYLPISIIWAMRMDNGSVFNLKGSPWIFGAYTDNALDIQDSIQNTIAYSHLYWSNSIVALDSNFNIYSYEEHLIKCHKCNQTYSDKFSNYAPSTSNDIKDAVCVLCKYSSNNENGFCPNDKTKCTYEFKDNINCSECFFNGGKLDPRMSTEENEYHLSVLDNYFKLKKEAAREAATCVKNDSCLVQSERNIQFLKYEIYYQKTSKVEK